MKHAFVAAIRAYYSNGVDFIEPLDVSTIYSKSNKFAEQIIRPTGLLDPTIEVKPSQNQIDDLIEQIQNRIEKNERTLVTTLTIRISEKLPEEQRAILVKAGKMQNFFSVLIENNCLQDSGNTKSRTTKNDDFLHGFGISNMRKAVEKYDGQLMTKCENGKFTLNATSGSTIQNSAK